MIPRLGELNVWRIFFRISHLEFKVCTYDREIYADYIHTVYIYLIITYNENTHTHAHHWFCVRQMPGFCRCCIPQHVCFLLQYQGEYEVTTILPRSESSATWNPESQDHDRQQAMVTTSIPLEVVRCWIEFMASWQARGSNLLVI